MKHFLILLIIIFTSCKSVVLSQSVQGEYTKAGGDYLYNLKLNKDSSFTLIQKYFEVNSTCIGKWQYLSIDTLLLKCDDEDLAAKLQSGYMNERNRKVIVLNKNELRLGNVVLKRSIE